MNTILWVFAACVAVVAWIAAGYGFGRTRAFLSGRGTLDRVARTVWSAVPTVWRTRRRLDDVVKRRVEPLGKDIDDKAAIEVFGCTVLLGLLSLIWYHVTALIFRDLFGDMAGIKLGPWTLAEMLAIAVILLEFITGYFLHSAVESFRKQSELTAPRAGIVAQTGYVPLHLRFAMASAAPAAPTADGPGFFARSWRFLIWVPVILTIIVGEIWLGARRVEIVASLAESWEWLSPASRAEYAALLRGTKPIFIGISILIPCAIMGLALAFHELLPKGVRMMGYGLGTTVLVIAIVGICLACGLLAVAGAVPWFVATILLPLLSIVLVVVPLGIASLVSDDAKDLLDKHRVNIGGTTTFLILAIAASGFFGCSSEPAAAPPPQVVEAQEMPKVKGRACVVDLSGSNPYRVQTAVACWAWLLSGSERAFVMSIGAVSDQSEAVQATMDEFVPAFCEEDRPEFSPPTSVMEQLKQRTAIEAAEAAHRKCLADADAARVRYEADRKRRLDIFVGSASRTITDRTDVAGALRRVRDWKRQAAVDIVDLRIYSDVEDTASEALEPKRIGTAQCSDVPPMSLANVAVTVHEIAAGKKWQDSEGLRRAWTKIFHECWSTEVTFTTFTVANE